MVVLLVVIGSVIFAVWPDGGPASAHRGHSGRSTTTSATTRNSVDSPPTSSGPDGIVSGAITAENRLPGTTSWQITGTSDGIEGFADTTYAAAGDHVGLYVSTVASSFSVVAYRMGYYGGAGGRQVWASDQIPGVKQPKCPVTSGINMVACDNWTLSLTVPITSAWTSGDYLLKLEGSGGQASYVLLVVWDPASTATYVIMNRSLTEEGWNTYGGYDFYQGLGPCPPGSGSYPPCNRARVVSFDRPFTGDGSSDFLTNEYPLVRWAEEQGLDVTYVSDITVDAHPDSVLKHRALLSLGHDELWTYDERKAVQAAFDHGVNVAFFGSAAVLRHARLQSSPLGPDQEEVDYRASTEDPLYGAGDPLQVTGNTWGSPPSSLSETMLVGEQYSGYVLPGHMSAALTVSDGSAWIFQGTGLSTGSAVPGVIASDIDHLAPTGKFPEDLQVFGHSAVPLTDVFTSQGKWNGFTYSDMTYFTQTGSLAGSFDSGTVTWILSMTPCPATTPQCPANTVSAITGNLLRVFGQGPAGASEPSMANWQTVTPPGS